MVHIFVLVSLIVAIVAVVFAIQNTIPVTVSFFVWQFKGSLALILLITLSIGIILSLLVSIPAVIRRKRIIAQQKKTIESLEGGTGQQVDEL